MKAKYSEFVFVVLVMLVSIFNMCGLLFDGTVNSTADLPTGELRESIPSKDNKNTLNLYVAYLNGVGYAVRGEVVSAADSEVNNIYWQIGTDELHAAWINKDTVMINGNRVNINGTPFDSRGKIELPEASYKNILQESK